MNTEQKNINLLHSLTVEFLYFQLEITNEHKLKT